jgi:hypothetical protein
MIHTDDKGNKVEVRLLGQNGPWRYVELPDGTAVNVHWSTLHAPEPPRKAKRYLKPPPPYRSPKMEPEGKP